MERDKGEVDKKRFTDKYVNYSVNNDDHLIRQSVSLYRKNMKDACINCLQSRGCSKLLQIKRVLSIPSATLLFLLIETEDLFVCRN